MFKNTQPRSTEPATDSGSDGVRIKLDGIRHEYSGSNGPVEAISRLDLQVEAGDFVALVGPSGCGKSTLLGMIAGFIEPTEGTVSVAETAVKEPGPDRGVVFQDSNLFPWLSARDNVAFPLRLRGVGRKERHEIADHWLEVVGLSGFGNAAPYELSGGMQQRCQIARVLAADPAVLLLDEPFGALDAMTRERLQDELRRIWLETGRTVIFVTHGVEEAAYISSRVVVLSERPGTLVFDGESPLDTPERSPDLRTAPELIEFREQINHHLRKKETSQ